MFVEQVQNFLILQNRKQRMGRANVRIRGSCDWKFGNDFIRTFTGYDLNLWGVLLTKFKL